jgi:hypothetical protein
VALRQPEPPRRSNPLKSSAKRFRDQKRFFFPHFLHFFTLKKIERSEAQTLYFFFWGFFG